MGWDIMSLRPVPRTRNTYLADRTEAEAVAVGLDHQPVHGAGLWGMRRWPRREGSLVMGLTGQEQNKGTRIAI